MSHTFIPKRVFFEPAALDYPLGQQLYQYFLQKGVEIKKTTSHNRVTGIPGNTPQQAYLEGKNTLVVGVRRSKDFQTCKPSAHYQLPLVTSCPGKCEYCYLATNLGKKPYIRIYVNIDEILQRAQEYIQQHLPEITLFEGAATSDPIPVEQYTGALKKTIEFFGQQAHGRFRFVTKFTDVDSLLNLSHNKHTSFRFSINSAAVIKKYEHSTPSMVERLAAAGKVAKAGYPLGFIIGPIILENDWQQQYRLMLVNLRNSLTPADPEELSFELITHRFTARAKNAIRQIFPNSQLNMNEEERVFKYGQFGYGKYLYPKEVRNSAKEFFYATIKELFPKAEIKYFV